MYFLFLCFIVCSNRRSGQSFDSADTCCNTCLRNKFEQSDFSGILYMGTTAELFGEVSHGNDTYFVAVFLTEQSHRAGFLCFLSIHDVGYNRDLLLNLFIYQILNFFQFFRCHSLEVGKVETESGRGYERTFLLYVCTENSL